MSHRGLKAQAGFTLMELLIAVAIIAIMAAAAVPGYQKTTERTYWNQAQDVLRAIYAGEQVQWGANSVFLNVATGGNWALIYMDNPNGAAAGQVQYWTQGANATQFTGVARRSAGPNNNDCMRITETGAIVFTGGGVGGCAGNWTQP